MTKADWLAAGVPVREIGFISGITTCGVKMTKSFQPIGNKRHAGQICLKQCCPICPKKYLENTL
jgi:hypothetical protein